jgi:hypothetical protein
LYADARPIFKIAANFETDHRFPEVRGTGGAIPSLGRDLPRANQGAAFPTSLGRSPQYADSIQQK